MKRGPSLILFILLIALMGIVVVQMGVLGQNGTGSNDTSTNGTGTNETSNNETDDEANSDRRTRVSKIKTRLLKRVDFVPQQKRNESECLEGCKCRGAVVSCPTETGRIMTISAGRSGNVIIITFEKVNATTELELEQESVNNKTKLKAKLSDGSLSEIKILPDDASRRALKRFRLKTCSEENNCTIELKEIRKDAKARAVYDVQLERHSKILGIFKKKMQVGVEIDSENGEIIKVRKPWWAFLATEPEEEIS